MEYIKKMLDIIKKLYRNIWFRTILFISIFLGFYIIRENVDITNNTRTILNLVLVGVFFVQLYQKLNEEKISIIRFLFIMIAAFILNQFYDSNIFFSIFEIKLNYVLILMGAVIFFYIIGSKVFDLINRRKKAGSKSKSSFSEKSNMDVALRGKTNNYNSIENTKTNINDFAYENDIIEQPRGYLNQNIEPQSIFKKNIKQQDVNRSEEFMFCSNEQNMKLHTGITIIVCLTTILLSILSFILLFSDNLKDKLAGMQIPNDFSVYISLIGFCFLWFFMWGVVVIVFIKLIQIIIDIINNKDSQNNYFLYASAVLVVSYFITDQYNLSLDKIIDSLVQGNILSFPVFLLILLPLFLTLLQNFETLIRKNGEKKGKIVNIVYELIFDIIEALLNFIKFTTADFLMSIQDIVKEDLNYKAEAEEQFSKDLGERADGETSNKSRESESNEKQE